MKRYALWMIALVPAVAHGEPADPPAPAAPAAPAPAPQSPVASTERPQPPPPEPQPVQPPAREPSPSDVSRAPLPGTESGRIDRPTQDSAGRQLARAALFLPKVAFEAAMAPFQGVLWTYDRYELKERYYQLFYNRDRTIGLVPTASYQTGFGLYVGGAFSDIDTFGENERLNLEAGYGGTYMEHLEGRIDTGQRLGRLVLGIGGNFDRRPSDPFYGIGNGDKGPEPSEPVNPIDTTAFGVHNRYSEARAFGAADLRVVDHLHLIGREALTQIKTSRSTVGIPIDEIFATDDLVGFDQTVSHLYSELELRWDHRGSASIWEPLDVYATGSLASAFVGDVHSLDGRPDFAHYGFELQQFLRLAPGPHVLALRLMGEGVTGGLDEVPFVELPYLGGDLLRGYPFERFRDRIAAFGTAQYMWDVSRFADAYIFTDAGRVYRSLDSLSLDHLRVGYGVGLQVHTDHAFLFEGSIASSLDGGVIFTVSFNRLLDERPRWR